LLRRTVERWCDWLDAANHLHRHRNWRHTPIYFDPDVEKRDLAGLGLVQRNYSEMNDWTKGAGQHLHAQFAQRYNQSPKWLTVGQAMASQEKRPWTYHEVDTFIIYLWPLLKRHNWTYRDLLNIVRSLLAATRTPSTNATMKPCNQSANVTMQPSNSFNPSNPSNSFNRRDTYPCQTEQEFSAHCIMALGLRKTGRGKTTPGGRPSGYDVAQGIFRAPPPKAS